MKQRLLDHIASISNPQLRAVCEFIPLVPEFHTAPASLSFHHAYEGGLLAHTVEVCDMALHSYVALRPDYGSEICTRFAKDTAFAVLPDRDTLITSALWHDLMKIREYERSEEANKFGGFWKHAESYGRQIHHIQGSAIEFTVAAHRHGVAADVIERVQHCILAHHGRKEWGSPVEPQTLEALILHQADMLSAKFGATKDQAP